MGNSPGQKVFYFWIAAILAASQQDAGGPEKCSGTDFTSVTVDMNPQEGT